ncbi:MAG: VOC family protein [Geodermatophilaceae bacterium]
MVRRTRYRAGPGPLAVRRHAQPDRLRPTRFMFIKVPERKTAKNRMHLDLRMEKSVPRSLEVARLVDLGATHIADKDEWGHSWAVLTDPEGNEFCVAANS